MDLLYSGSGVCSVCSDPEPVYQGITELTTPSPAANIHTDKLKVNTRLLTRTVAFPVSRGGVASGSHGGANAAFCGGATVASRGGANAASRGGTTAAS